MACRFAGPYISTKASATFTLSPLATSWWTLNGSFDVLAGMRFKFLGLEIADVGGSFLHVPDLCGSHKRSPDGINPPAPARQTAAG